MVASQGLLELKVIYLSWLIEFQMKKAKDKQTRQAILL